MELYLSKSQRYFDDVIRTRETYINSNPTSSAKSSIVLNVSAKFEQDQVKDEEAVPILISTVF